MPTRRTAYGYLAFACFLTFLFGLQPTAVISAFLAISFAAAGVLSIPRITYPKVLLHLTVMGLFPAILVFYLTRAPYLCLASFAVVPATALLVLTIRKRHSRSAGIFWATFALGVLLIASLLWWLHLTRGGLSVSLFRNLYQHYADLFAKHLTPVLNFDDQSLFMTPIDPQEYVSALYTQLVLLLPSLYIMVLWVGAWLSTVIIRWIFMNYVYGADRFAKWSVTAHRSVAWIYISAFLLASLTASFSSNDIAYIISVVCNNVYIILMPTFVIIGCRTIKERMLRAPGCGCMTFMMFGMFLFAFYMIPSLLAFTGAFQAISPKRFIPAPPPTADEENNDSNGPDNPDDSANPPNKGGNDS